LNIKSVAAAAIVAAFAVAMPAQAATTLLTFDTGIGNFSPVPNGYGGLNWSNFYGYSKFNRGASGYKNGMVSPDFVVFKPNANPASISSSTDFQLASGYLTGAWNDGMTVTVKGYNNSALIYTQNFVVTSVSPTFVSFNNALVDNVVFSSAGGTSHGYGGYGYHFVLDNLTIGANVPEPASRALMIVGFGLVGVSMRRRKVALAA